MSRFISAQWPRRNPKSPGCEFQAGATGQLPQSPPAELVRRGWKGWEKGPTGIGQSGPPWLLFGTAFNLSIEKGFHIFLDILKYLAHQSHSRHTFSGAAAGSAHSAFSGKSITNCPSKSHSCTARRVTRMVTTPPGGMRPSCGSTAQEAKAP